jgi:hypothetical protein
MWWCLTHTPVPTSWWNVAFPFSGLEGKNIYGNMADASCSEMISVQVSKRTLSDKKENVCKCCEKIKVELNEVKLELDCCRDIIRVLQEEVRGSSSSTQPAGNKVNEDYEDKETYNSLASEEWTSFSSNQRRNLQYTRRNLLQLPLQTSPV